MKWKVTGCALLGMALLLPTPNRTVQGDQKDPFTPLFNGKDLTGWVRVNNAPNTFYVKDKEIITTGVPTGYLRTDKMYENFIAEFEWKHIPKKPGAIGNSGFFVWCDPLPALGTGYSRGIEVQVLVNLTYTDKKTGKVTASSHGDIFSIHGATCEPDRPHPKGSKRCIPSENRCKGEGEWNHYRVEANDGAIKLAVNGKVVSGVSKCRPRKGYLALEAEGSECHFRNLKIKELPSTNPKPEEVANEGKDFVTLFTGMNLDGWKGGEGYRDHWKALPGPNVLRYDGKAGKKGVLTTEKEYKDFELVCDCKLPKGGPASLLLRGSDKAVVDLSKGLADNPHRFSVTLKGAALTVKQDGKVVQEAKLAGVPLKGPISLVAESPATFQSIFIRELK